MGHTNFYGYDPSEVLACVAALRFGLSGLVHAAQLWRYKTFYLTPIAIGAMLELCGYIVRLQSRQNPTNVMLYSTQHALILISPVFFAAADYIILSRIISFVGPQYSPVRPHRIAKIFVASDIFAFFIQLSGTGLLLATSSISMQNSGLKVLIAGLLVQVVSFFFFLALAIQFHRKARNVGGRWKLLLIALYISSLLILIRSVFRCAEFWQGFESPLATTEKWMYVFDTGMMFWAIAVFHFVHPGAILVERAKVPDDEKRSFETAIEEDMQEE